MNTINVENCKTLLIGRRGENEVTTVAFDFTEWASEFGSGVVDLYVKRFGDNSAYPVVLTIDGTVASWLVTATDTNVAGYGKAEYVYRVDGKIAKSAVFPFFVAEDIGQPASEPPDPYESWLEQLTALGAETEAHAQAAEQSAENAAESAEDAAQSAASAEGYAGQAETAAGLAQAAQTASEAARDAAQTAQASAESSATAASGSAASAASSATAAAGSASDASTSASSAGASASAASASATTASNAATAAQAAQSAAEDAAEDAQQAAQQAHVEYEQLSGEVDDLSDEVSQQKSAIEDLQDLTNRKAGMLVDSVSGAIASFVPDATIPDLLSVSVDIEPVQDLHGYDAPWPAGGGKNKFGCADGSYAIGSTRTAIVTNGVWSYKVNAAATSSVFLPEATVTAMNIPALKAGTYTFSLASNAAASSVIASAVLNLSDGQAITNGNSFTISADTSVVSITTPRSGEYAVGTYTCQIQIESGSTASAWTPYENICPISGWDAVEVSNTSTNIWDEQWEIGAIVNGNPVANASSIRSKNFSACVPSSSIFVASPRSIILWWYDKDRLYTGQYTSIGQQALVVPAKARYFKIGFPTAYGTTYNHDISINYPATDHAYHPYAGNRYIIQLGQTVYGGTLTIAEDGSVNALVDRAKRHFSGGNDAWVVGVGAGVNCNRAAFQFSDALLGSNNGIVSDVFKSEIQSTPKLYHGMVNNNGSLLLGVPTTVADRAAMNSWAAENPFDIVYYIAPIEIQLDPVTISTIANQTNNVWADAGDVDVTFAADIKAYIDRMNQPTEDDMIANTLIQSGKYFTINNRLFLSTASIAAGAMIIPGTNCQETSLAAALNALNA